MLYKIIQNIKKVNLPHPHEIQTECLSNCSHLIKSDYFINQSLIKNTKITVLKYKKQGMGESINHNDGAVLECC